MMSPWQFEQIRDPRKPPVDPGPRGQSTLERDERERSGRPDLSTQAALVDDGE